MADTFRGPLFVGRREPPVQVATVFVAASLLVTTLASVISAPVGAQSFPAQVQQRLVLNADTTRGTPKPLIADAQLPVGNPAPHFAPAPHSAREGLNPDTTRGTPKTLTLDAQTPVGRGAPQFAPTHHSRNEWLPTDTTQDTPLALRTVVAPAPLVNPPGFAPLRYWWQPPDESAGTPKTLTFDAQAPVFNAPAFAPAQVLRNNNDTTQDTPLALLTAVVAPPFVNAPQFMPDRLRPVTDTSQDTPLVLLPPPFVPAPAFVPARSTWQPADTSRATAKTLTLDAQAPVFNPPGFAPQQHGVREGLPADTSLRQPITLQTVVAPAPVVIAPMFAPIRASWQPADSTHGTPKTLTADAQAPVFNAPPSLWPDRQRAIVDTTQDTPLPLLVAAAILPPGAQTAPSTPFYPWQRKAESTGTPKPLIADAQAPVFNAPGFAPVHHGVRELLNNDTTADQPLTIRTPIAPPPFIVAPHLAPARQRVVVDTTQDTPLPLLTAVPPALPPGATVRLVPLHRRPLVFNTARGSPLALIVPSVAVPPIPDETPPPPTTVFSPGTRIGTSPVGISVERVAGSVIGTPSPRIGRKPG